MFHIVDVVLFAMFAGACIMLVVGAVYGIVQACRRHSSWFRETLDKIINLIQKDLPNEYTELINTFCDAEGFDEWVIKGFNSEGEKLPRTYLTFFKDEKEVMSIDVDRNYIYINGKQHVLNLQEA